MRMSEKFWKIVFLSLFAFAGTSWAGGAGFDPNGYPKSSPENMQLRLNEMALTNHDGQYFHLRCAIPGKYKPIPGMKTTAVNLKAGESRAYNKMGWMVSCGPQPKAPAPRVVPAPVTFPVPVQAPAAAVVQEATPTQIQGERIGIQQPLPQISCQENIFTMTKNVVMINGRECVAHNFVGRAIDVCTLYKDETWDEAKARHGITDDRRWSTPNKNPVMINGRHCVVHDFIGRLFNQCTLYRGETGAEAAERFGIYDGRPWPKHPLVAEYVIKRTCTGTEIEIGRSPALDPAVAKDWEQIQKHIPPPPPPRKRPQWEIDADLRMQQIQGG